jgi:hypothetical protein
MGAWGTAAFDNDDASDWVYDLEKRGLEAIEAAIADVEGATDLEMPTDANAIAAGEVVAAAMGRPVDGLRDDIAALAKAIGRDLTPEHVSRARAAVQRVIARSELAELWDETAQGGEWRRSVDDLVLRLTA